MYQDALEKWTKALRDSRHKHVDRFLLLEKAVGFVPLPADRANRYVKQVANRLIEEIGSSEMELVTVRNFPGSNDRLAKWLEENLTTEKRPPLDPKTNNHSDSQ